VFQTTGKLSDYGTQCHTKWITVKSISSKKPKAKTFISSQAYKGQADIL